MFDGREPIYVQIAQAIRDEIISGALTEGDQVMSTTQYATRYRINPATAAKAFAELVDEGVLYKQRGVGMFVADGASARLRGSHRDSFFTERLAPVLREARLLGISPEDLIDHIRADADTVAPTTPPSTTDHEGSTR